MVIGNGKRGSPAELTCCKRVFSKQIFSEPIMIEHVVSTRDFCQKLPECLRVLVLRVLVNDTDILGVVPKQDVAPCLKSSPLQTEC